MNIHDAEFTTRKHRHLALVTRDPSNFAKWYDKAAAAVFDGMSKGEAIDLLAPWDCDQTQSNGVVAGALQATALLRDTKEG